LRKRKILDLRNIERSIHLFLEIHRIESKTPSESRDADKG